MREDSFRLPFTKGLRPFPDLPRNSGFLEECHGLRVYAEHLTGLATLAALSFIPEPSADMQLFCLRDANYLVMDGKIYTLSTALLPSTHVLTSVSTTFWSVADFGPYVVFSNGTTIYVTSPTTGIVSAYAGSDIPVCGVVCDYKGQLIGGNPTGYDSNVVLWGSIGWANMDLMDSRTAGYMPMPWQGVVYKVQRLGEHIAVYGQDGVALLAATDTVPPGFGLREVVATQGLIAQQAMAGSIWQQLFVRSDGVLCMMEADRNKPIVYKYTELGYQEYLAGLTGVIVSYDDALSEWYIASDTTCFVFTRGGLSTTGRKVYTCQTYRGSLWGLYDDPTTPSAYVKTCELDMGARADKAIEYVEVGSDGSWWVSVDWRRSTSDSFVASPSFPLNPMGAGRAKVSGMDFKIKLTSSSAAPQLDYMTVRWKYQDKRFLRGQNANPSTTRADRSLLGSDKAGS